MHGATIKIVYYKLHRDHCLSTRRKQICSRSYLARHYFNTFDWNSDWSKSPFERNDKQIGLSK